MRNILRNAAPLIAIAVGGIVGVACGGDRQDVDVVVNVTAPTPTTPTPFPSPVASPTGGGVGAGFDNVGIFAFGYENDDDATTPACVAPPEGSRMNPGGQYIVPPGCSLALTATAFDRAGNPVHLAAETAITWADSGAGFTVPRAPTAFNRTYRRTAVGFAFVSVVVEGKQGVRGFDNR